MAGTFSVLTTPAFERNFQKLARGNPALVGALDRLIAILGVDPYNRSGRHPIRKLAGVKAGDGQWRIRWTEYRLRYDIFETDVVLHAFRHRKDAY
jgi:mRNA-degrading endonuclease RelE of RelBE toxin-antitoxin system